MNKRLVFALSALMIATLACSTISINVNSVTGSGNVISEARNVSGFDSVALEGSGRVTISVGEGESVTVEADDNIVPLIETRVENYTLIISTRNNTNITTRNAIRINIAMNSLKAIYLRGSGEINASGVDGDKFEIQLPGSGNITASGTANSLNISLPGSGNVTCDGLKVKSATISLNGYLPLYLRNIGWTTVGADGAITVLNGAGMLGTIPMVMLAGRLGKYKVLLFVSVLSMVATLALLPFASGPAVWTLLAVGAFIRGGCFAMTNVLVFGTRGVGAAYGGTAMGLLSWRRPEISRGHQVRGRSQSLASPVLGICPTCLRHATQTRFGGLRWAVRRRLS